MLPRGLGTPLTSGTGSFSEAQISLAPAFVQETLSSHLLSAADVRQRELAAPFVRLALTSLEVLPVVSVERAETS